MRASPVAERRRLGTLLRSVVKVLAVSDSPDYAQPWQTRGTSSSAGSGAVVSTLRGPRVLTNAHCVENHAFVEVRRYGKTRKYVARVEALGHECDLALLSIEDGTFFSGTEPIALGELPELSDPVQVCGYPIGGERLSITEGVVSRIEVVPYAQKQWRLLAVQIDAAINPGNSGGPVLKDGKLIGVAFQALEDAEQIGYIIATPIIEHFLKDFEDDRYDGFPAVGVVTQPLESEAHRRDLGLPANFEDGVLVTRAFFGSSAWGILEPTDVLLEVDGVRVAADGTVPFRDEERLDFDWLVSRHQVGERIDVVVWRDGVELSCVLPLKPPAYLVAEDRYDVRPSYFIFGGLLFVPLTKDYLKTWGDDWGQRAPRDLVALYENGITTPERTEPVVVQKVLADRVNQGYHEMESVLLRAVQSQPIRSLAHLVQVVKSSTETFLRFVAEDGRRIVIDRAQAIERHARILERFGVPHDRSADLRR